MRAITRPLVKRKEEREEGTKEKEKLSLSVKMRRAIYAFICKRRSLGPAGSDQAYCFDSLRVTEHSVCCFRLIGRAGQHTLSLEHNCNDMETKLFCFLL
ncbi:hypothetical protein AVEN_92751-1 [Araneus ventricosus]|uniref:Uncharacterized protein n=1 Tax=Araneus ventricosus TaxID=182803 RepID=A0A4Y2KDC9_ARAVE|nr:hypothetical protein AVEN_92751-1 [Araneus ventricosus]